MARDSDEKHLAEMMALDNERKQEREKRAQRDARLAANSKAAKEARRSNQTGLKAAKRRIPTRPAHVARAKKIESTERLPRRVSFFG